ncbi:ABC transporter ATP-binding protein [Microbacterium sp. A94]|uniref:ABC transporter ATP-binding protein n=1 Tax=Microbacterium sp. A94 TaxID=3450717 RepID=UPI003F43258B
MSTITIENLHKSFGGVGVIRDLSVSIEHGEFVTLLGPSGCGKTTTLRCLAGLEVPDAGKITVDGRTLAHPEQGVLVPPHDRSIGMVFQNYALWPHMTVGQNVAYPMRLRGVSRTEIRSRIHELLTKVELSGLEDRYVHQLSGGQQQRVALARALAHGSTLVLYDEPLSNLDAKLRDSMRRELRGLHEELGATSIFVTHDQEEALTLSDRIIVMDKGRIEQVGTPEDVYLRPATATVADFMGFENILTGTASVDDDGWLVRIDNSSLTLRVEEATPGPVTVAFRSAGVRVGDQVRRGDGNELTGQVLGSFYLGRRVEIDLDVGGVRVLAAVSALGRDGVRPKRGDRLQVQIDAEHLAVFPNTR